MYGSVKVPEAKPNVDAGQASASERAHRPLGELETFRAALEAGFVGVWSWDLRSNHMTWSTRLADFHGRPENGLDGALSITPQELPAQDAAGVLAAIRSTLQTHEPCRLEYRLPSRSGQEARRFEPAVTALVEDGVAVQLLGPR